MTVLRLALALSLSLAALVGCGPAAVNPVERIAGKWHGQMVVNEEGVRGVLNEQQVAELAAMQMELDIQPDGTLVVAGVNNGQAYSSNSHWELVSATSEKITIKSVDAQSGKEKNIDMYFHDANTFAMPLKTEVAELGAMRFERLR